MQTADKAMRERETPDEDWLRHFDDNATNVSWSHHNIDLGHWQNVFKLTQSLYTFWSQVDHTCMALGLKHPKQGVAGRRSRQCEFDEQTGRNEGASRR